MGFQRFFGMVKGKKRIKLKNFQQLYDLAMKHLDAGQEQVLIGDLLLKIYPPKFPEDKMNIHIRPNSKIWRRRLFEPDEISMHIHTSRIKCSDATNSSERFRVYVYNEEKNKLYRCEFKMSEPLKRLKKVFPNTYVSYMVDSLLTYDGE
ncbi:MAG: hypothetical protein K2M42_08580 [Oscillospiraceae bacterium]|nr:hypothetical protein [Oscillospiraceae bacterium]